MSEFLLRARRMYLNGLISVCENDLADEKRKLESLREFKNKASSTQNDLMSNERQRLSYVNKLASLSSKCKSAERFRKGFKMSLSTYGNFKVNASYSRLEENIDDKIRSYEETIDNLNTNISSYSSQIRQIDRDIAALEDED